MNWRIPKTYLQLGFLAVSAAALFGCDGGFNRDDESGGENGETEEVSFEHHGLDNHAVNRLYHYNGRIFAGTDQGLYQESATGQWQDMGLAEADIHDIAFLNDGHYIASVQVESEGATADYLVETTDGGENWNRLSHNFGGEQTESIYALHYDDYNNALYATGVAALAASYDNGRSWELLNGMWGGFGRPKYVVTHNPATNEIWYGGQNAIEEMVLVRYSLDTMQERRFTDLLPSPSVIYGIEFSPVNEQHVYVSGEGGIVKTENNGEDWSTLMGDVDHRFYFEVAIDPQQPETLFTGGWDKQAGETQPLIFEVSTDDGQTWQEHRPDNDSLNGGIRTVLAREELSSTIVYLGLYGGGIVKVTGAGE